MSSPLGRNDLIRFEKRQDYARISKIRVFDAGSRSLKLELGAVLVRLCVL